MTRNNTYSRIWHYVFCGILALSFQLSSAQWTLVGDVYTSDQSTHQSIALNSQGLPFVAFKDGSQFGKISVITLDNDVWVNVGTAGFSTEGFFGTDYQSLAFDSNDVPYVAFRDLNNGSKCSVMKFNGIEWEYVGPVGITTGAVGHVSLAIDSQGLPHVAFRESPLADKCSVMRFDGSQWNYVGDSGFSSWNSSVAYVNLLIDDNDKLFVAYQEEIYDDGASVLTFDGSEWVYVGTPGFSGGSTSYESLAIDDFGQLYIAYRDNALSGKCTVMTYVDDAWEALGVAGISTGATSYTSLQIDYAGRVIVAFKDWANGSRTSVKRFENEEWTDVGSSGFSTASANYQDLAINALGHMFVAYEIGDVEVQRFVVDGCTSTDACNFDPDATDDDESCVILEVFEISGELLPQAGTAHTYTYPPTAGSTYLWEVVNGTIISGQGTATVEIEWGSVGDAQLSVVETNAELCESPLVELAITVPVSLEDIDSEELLIYPNPANDIVFISLPTGMGQLSIKVFDARGLEVWDGSVNQQSSEIAVGHLAPGAYHLVAQSSDSTWVNSLILKR